MKKYVKLYEEFVNNGVIENINFHSIQRETYLPIGLASDFSSTGGIVSINKQAPTIFSCSAIDSDTEQDLLDWYDNLEEANVMGHYTYDGEYYNITTIIGASIYVDNIDRLLDVPYPLVDTSILKFFIMSKDEALYKLLIDTLKIEKDNFECYLKLLEFKHSGVMDEEYIKDKMIRNTVELIKYDIGYDLNNLPKDILKYIIYNNIELGLSSDFIDIASTAIKGNHKLK